MDDTICDSGFSDILNIWITHCLVAGVLFAAAVANGRYRELWRNGYMFSISRRPFIRSAAKKESLKSPNTKAREKRRRAKVPSNQVSKQVQQQGLVGPLSPGSDAMGGGELSEADFLHYGIRGSMFNRAVIMEDLNNIAEVVEEEPLDDDEDEDEDIDEEYGEEEATTVCEEEPVVEEDMVPEPTAELSDGPIINPIVVTENASRWVANEADYPEGGESL